MKQKLFSTVCPNNNLCMRCLLQQQQAGSMDMQHGKNVILKNLRKTCVLITLTAFAQTKQLGYVYKIIYFEITMSVSLKLWTCSSYCWTQNPFVSLSSTICIFHIFHNTDTLTCNECQMLTTSPLHNFRRRRSKNNPFFPPNQIFWISLLETLNVFQCVINSHCLPDAV